MSNKITDVDAIISEIELDLKQQAQHAGTPKITQNTVAVLVRDFTYQTPSPLVTPVSINHLSYKNGTDESTTAKFPTLTKTTTKTLSFSFTEGFKFGSKSTAEVEVPEVAEASEEISLELDFSATQAITKTTEQSWTYNEPIPVPKRSKICADLIIKKNTYDTGFSAEAVLTGMITAHAESNSHGSKKEFTVSMGVAFWLHKNKSKYPHIKFEDFQTSESQTYPLKAIIPVTGKFKGVSGSNLEIEVKQLKIGKDCPTGHPTADILIESI